MDFFIEFIYIGIRKSEFVTKTQFLLVNTRMTIFTILFAVLDRSFWTEIVSLSRRFKL